MTIKSTIIIVTALVSIAFTSLASDRTVENPEQIRPIACAPILARECEAGKTVYMTIDIDTHGNVINAEARVSNDSDAFLAKRVERSVMNWKFTPVNDTQGRATAVTVVLPIYIDSVRNS